MNASQANDDTSIRFSLLDMGDAPTRATPEKKPAPAPVAPAATPAPAVDLAQVAQASQVQPSPSRAYTAAGRLRDAKARLERAQAEVKRLTGEEAPEAAIMTRDDLIGGIEVAGGGVTCGWSGAGKLTRRELLEILDAAGLDSSLAPKVKKAKNYAGQAIRALRTEGYVVTSAKKVDAAWDSAWQCQRVNTEAQFGESGGTIEIFFELHGEELRARGDAFHGGNTIRAFNEAMLSQVYNAGEITAWLKSTLRNWGGVEWGLGTYLPAHAKSKAKALLNSLAPIWGIERKWSNCVPMATSDQLMEGIAVNLRAEINDLAREFAKYDSKRAGEVGPRAITNLIKELNAQGERVRAFSALLGAERCEGIKAVVDSLLKQVERHSSSAAIRGALIWDEIERMGDKATQ